MAMEPTPTEPNADLKAHKQRVLDRLLAEEGLDEHAAPTIGRRADASAPLTFAQEVLWLLDRATPGLTAYNSPVVRRIRGRLDVAALERAVTQLAARHEALRTTFDGAGDSPRQVVHAPAPVSISVRDVRERAAAERERVAMAFLRELADTPFDLTREPAFRVALARLGDEEYLLLVLTHHIISDAWSYGIIFRELSACYDAAARGTVAELPPVTLQLGDYAAWQRTQLSEREIAAHLAFWRERLEALPLLELPTDKPRPAMPGFGGARRAAMISGPLRDRLRELAQQRGVTMYMMLLAAYQTVLHRYSGQDDIVVGSAVAARTRRETEGMIGYLSQALPMRTRFDGDPTFAELLARVSETALGAFEHQDVPLERLVLEGGRALTHAPLFRVVLTMQEGFGADLRLSGAAVTPVELDASATKFDLTMLVTETPDGLELSLWYRTDLFVAATVDRFLAHFVRVLEAVAAEPKRRVSVIGMLADAERAELAAWGTGPGLNGHGNGSTFVHRQFAARAVLTPDLPALIAGDANLTYGALDARANQLAHRLRALGVTASVPVGLALERTADVLVGLLGIIKAGGAYVPLAPDLPPSRIAQQIAEVGARVVVTKGEVVERLPASGITFVCLDVEARALAAERSDDPGVALSPDDLAYVLFTSGSTGTPKGVAVTHGNLASYVKAICARLGITSRERMHFATVTSLGADLGNTAIFPALVSGGALHVIPRPATHDGLRFAEYVTAHPIDVLKITPSHLRALMSACGERAAEVLPRRWLVLGGEACPWELVEQVQRLGRCSVVNHYGPTETTVGCCVFGATPEAVAAARAAGAQTVPIGRPLPNVQLRILDAHRQSVPQGVPGELYIAGPGVSRGYLHRDDLTAERFVELPEIGRAYRTGDRVRWLATGDIEFLGRLDDQVKVRGFRVELGEIERVLAEHPAVAQVVVLLRARGSGSREPAAGNAGDGVLVAYTVAKTAGYAAAHTERATADTLRTWVEERLPDYMVPSAFVMLDALPLTANGKLDRRALPDPQLDTSASTYVAPRTPTEESIAAIWAEVLKHPQPSVTASFLELGGHSLLAIRILGKMSRTFGVRLPLRALFDSPSIEQLARAVDDARRGAALTGV